MRCKIWTCAWLLTVLSLGRNCWHELVCMRHQGGYYGNKLLFDSPSADRGLSQFELKLWAIYTATNHHLPFRSHSFISSAHVTPTVDSRDTYMSLLSMPQHAQPQICPLTHRLANHTLSKAPLSKECAYRDYLTHLLGNIYTALNINTYRCDGAQQGDL